MAKTRKNEFELLQKLILESQNKVNHDISGEIEDLKSSIAASEKKLVQVNKYSSKLNSDIIDSQKSIQDANILISKQKEVITELTKELKKVDWERNRDNDQQKQSLEELLLNLEKKSEELNDFTLRLNNLNESISSEKVALDEKLGTIQNEIESSREEIDNVQSGLDLKIQKNHSNLESFSSLVKDDEYLKSRVDPFVNDKLQNVKDNFQSEYSEKLGPAVTQIMVENQESFIQVLYPMMGKLIKAFVKSEMEKLFESVNSRVDNTFSANAIKRRFRSIFTGVSVSELAAKEAFSSNIESVYIIHKESGLLIGSYTKEKKVDEDMLAGMLTAIKQFSEEAFNHGQEDLSTIDYGDNKVYIQNFYKYYVAVVLNGIFDAVTKEKLESHLLEFSENHLSRSVSQVDGELYENISNKLKLSIYEFNQIS